MFIDFHTHIFPESIAKSALQKMAFDAGALKPALDGTRDSLMAELVRLDGRAVLLPIATRPSQQKSINGYSANMQCERLFAFGSIHPDAPDALEELECIRDLGLKGIKFHPEYQQFYVDDPRMFPIYRKAASLGLITVFHAGADLAFDLPCHCTPERMRRALPAFDGAPVVAAHFGGYMYAEQVLKELVGLPLYLDTSFSHGHFIKPIAERIIREHGADKILFGSDAPWSPIEYEIDFLRSLRLEEEERNKILLGNAMHLLMDKDR